MEEERMFWIAVAAFGLAGIFTCTLFAAIYRSQVRVAHCLRGNTKLSPAFEAQVWKQATRPTAVIGLVCGGILMVQFGASYLTTAATVSFVVGAYLRSETRDGEEKRP
jgi:Na+/H+-translocating membrane pyrophosphatase